MLSIFCYRFLLRLCSTKCHSCEWFLTYLAVRYKKEFSPSVIQNYLRMLLSYLNDAQKAMGVIIEQERRMEVKNDKKYCGVAGVVFNTAVIHTLFLHKVFFTLHPIIYRYVISFSVVKRAEFKSTT